MYVLTLWVDAIAALLFILAGFRYGAGLFSRGVRLRSRLKIADLRALVACVALYTITISIFGIMVNKPALGFFLPVLVEYFFGSIARVYCAALIGFTASATIRVAMLERHPFRWFGPAVCLLALVGTQYVFALNMQTNEGNPPELRGPRVSTEGIILQSCGSSCAAASCANIARHFGIEKTEEDMVKLLGTTENGTTTSQIVLGMRKLGFNCHKRFTWAKDPSLIHPPAVLLIGNNNYPDNHAVALMKSGEDQYEICNPLMGKHMMTREELARVWGGRAVEFWK